MLIPTSRRLYEEVVRRIVQTKMRMTDVPRLSHLLAGAILLVPAAGAAAGQTRQICDVTVDITDTDPHGTHVRGAPGGAVIATHSNPGDGWIEVHVTAQLGDWYEIDKASLIDNTHPATLFRGRAYVHKSMIGVSGMQNGAALFADHDGRRPLISHLAGDQPVVLLGCWAPFSK